MVYISLLGLRVITKTVLTCAYVIGTAIAYSVTTGAAVICG